MTRPRCTGVTFFGWHAAEVNAAQTANDVAANRSLNLLQRLPRSNFAPRAGYQSRRASETASHENIEAISK
jgi:hypothetical protein